MVDIPKNPLRLLEWNLQDFFVEPVYPLSREALQSLSENQWQLLAGDTPLKPLAKLRQIAEVIEELEPDVAMLCEVGGLPSLTFFADHFLGGQYKALLERGNSDRGIENGFLVRKTLHATIASHRHWPVSLAFRHESDPKAHRYAAEAALYANLGDRDQRRLSRDIPLLLLMDQSRVRAAILLAHLKSGFDVIGIDPGGETRRAAELQALIEIADHTRQRLGRDVPLILGGDFNGQANRENVSAEFLPLYAEAAGYEDVLALRELPQYERITQVSFIHRQVMAQQLDYMFLPRDLHDRLIDAFVYRYRFAAEDGQIGSEMMLPLTFRDRAQLPSDHYPLVADLDI